MSFLQPPFWSRDVGRAWSQHVSITVVTPPAVEPISVATAKLFLNIVGPEQDALVYLFIRTARASVENFIFRAVASQTWDVYLDRLPPNGLAINLPLTPLQSVTSIKTTDVDGVQTTLASSTYVVDTSSEPARIGLPTGQIWPLNLGWFRPVVVRIVVGYADAASIPPAILQAMLLLVGHYYENRTASTVGIRFDAVLPYGVESLLAPYQIVSVA